jgi:hypothetical protein
VLRVGSMLADPVIVCGTERRKNKRREYVHVEVLCDEIERL